MMQIEKVDYPGVFRERAVNQLPWSFAGLGVTWNFSRNGVECSFCMSKLSYNIYPLKGSFRKKIELDDAWALPTGAGTA